MILEQTKTESITLTQEAAGAVRDLLTTRNLPGYALRVFISGGGCSGYQYGMTLEKDIRENDLAYDFYGVKVVVDEVSNSFLQGATIDFVDGPEGGGFKVVNPNALGSRGCDYSTRSRGEADSTNPYGGCSGC